MKKELLTTCYQFLAANVKIGALSDAQTRATFIKFFRGLRKVAQSVIDEMKAAQQPPLDQASEETIRQILNEEYVDELPKIKEDLLLEVLAESKCEVPLAAIFNSFEGFIEE